MRWSRSSFWYAGCIACVTGKPSDHPGIESGVGNNLRQGSGCETSWAEAYNPAEQNAATQHHERRLLKPEWVSTREWQCEPVLLLLRSPRLPTFGHRPQSGMAATRAGSRTPAPPTTCAQPSLAVWLHGLGKTETGKPHDRWLSVVTYPFADRRASSWWLCVPIPFRCSSHEHRTSGNSEQ